MRAIEGSSFHYQANSFAIYVLASSLNYGVRVWPYCHNPFIDFDCHVKSSLLPRSWESRRTRPQRDIACDSHFSPFLSGAVSNSENFANNSCPRSQTSSSRGHRQDRVSDVGRPRSIHFRHWTLQQPIHGDAIRCPISGCTSSNGQFSLGNQSRSMSWVRFPSSKSHPSHSLSPDDIGYCGCSTQWYSQRA